MPLSRPIRPTVFALLAFAGNALLCRAALHTTAIDAVSFTALRLAAGAAMLRIVMRGGGVGGSWASAVALFVYAAAFSYAYDGLTAATGALILFVAVQITMIAHGLWSGERLAPRQQLGCVLAIGGLIYLSLPGLARPPLEAALLMVISGVAWGVYSLRGRASRDPGGDTAGNFLRTMPMTAFLMLVCWPSLSLDTAGAGYAVVSGAIGSGLAYIFWYRALPQLPATIASAVQLAVPILAAAGGIVLLGESLTMRLLIASVAMLGGLSLVLLNRRSA